MPIANFWLSKYRLLKLSQTDFSVSKIASSLMASRFASFVLKVFSLPSFRNCTKIPSEQISWIAPR